MRAARLLLTLLLPLASIGCGRSDLPLVISDVRDRAAPEVEVPWGLTSRDRFEGDPHGAAAHGSAASGENSTGLSWTLPEGWVALPTRDMRIVTVAPAAAPEAECYVSVLAGSAGGVLANINRWREQMGLEGLGEDALQQLPTIEVLGQARRLVALTGTFTGMDGQAATGAGLLGVVCPRTSDTLFVKMTGPADVVRAEQTRFEAFCRSLRERGDR